MVDENAETLVLAMGVPCVIGKFAGGFPGVLAVVIGFGGTV